MLPPINYSTPPTYPRGAHEMPVIEESYSNYDRQPSVFSFPTESNPYNSDEGRRSLNSSVSSSSSPVSIPVGGGGPSSLANPFSSSHQGHKPHHNQRIPHKDIRREYANIFVNALNTGDHEIIEEALQKYCIPECITLCKHVGNNTSQYGGDHVEVIGLPATIQFWKVLFCAYPDSLFRIEENKIRVLTTGYASSISKFLFYGTKVYYMPSDNDHQTVVYKMDSDSLNNRQTEDLKNKGNNQPNDQSAVAASLAVLAEIEGKEGTGVNIVGGIPVASGGKTGVEEIVCANIPKSIVKASDYSLEKSINDISLSKRYDGNEIPMPTIEIDKNAASTTDFSLGEKLEQPQSIIVIGTFTVFINPSKKEKK
jgi:hypothetical protein